eukprot:CAMPEP_0201513376 /NCGR_PEP_ID=MMETSP0161_2-20130828/5438_1 /ASSEMBLY_ACC=CAM_ASM_000251 /TAXON_ID=180227 /ORGANISM="Neoparamoeba aestuarina, Strain SoJaBio B1-5/56/2" /LENGTH=36 /DNA_ID= /DNA_START= /DNA_END= /DNA_ORIENTATION=
MPFLKKGKKDKYTNLGEEAPHIEQEDDQQADEEVDV